MSETFDIRFDNNTREVTVEARWVELDDERTDDIFVRVSADFGEWSQMLDCDSMLDHLLNEWKLTTLGDAYHLHPDFATWLYIDSDSFETMRDRVIDLVRQDELNRVTAKFANLTSKGE